MRIIGGQAGGRVVRAPKGLDVRPTPDLVRQAIFNSLGARVHGAKVLELFGGTGALSLESLSRGAASAICVELSPRHARGIRDNYQFLKLDGVQFEVRVGDAHAIATQFQAEGRRFDLIFADPPYGEKNRDVRSTSHAQKLLDHPALPLLMAPGATFVLGHSRRDTLELPPAWTERKLLRHGDSIIRLLEPSPAPQSNPQSATDDLPSPTP